MYDVSAGKVHGADRGEKTAFAPYHMRHRIIDDHRPQSGKQKQSLEFHASHQSACDQGGGNHRKHHLKRAVDQMRKIVRVRSCLHADAVQAEPAEITDDSQMVASKGQRISEQSPHDNGKSHDRHAGHHGAADIFSAHKPSVKECQSRCHEKYKCCAEQHKSSIASIHNNSSSNKHLFLADPEGPFPKLRREFRKISRKIKKALNTPKRFNTFVMVLEYNIVFPEMQEEFLLQASDL